MGPLSTIFAGSIGLPPQLLFLNGRLVQSAQSRGWKYDWSCVPDDTSWGSIVNGNHMKNHPSLWVVNILAFASCYWRLDTAGCNARDLLDHLMRARSCFRK
jgi:hypothetical protein